MATITPNFDRTGRQYVQYNADADTLVYTGEVKYDKCGEQTTSVYVLTLSTTDALTTDFSTTLNAYFAYDSVTDCP